MSLTQFDLHKELFESVELDLTASEKITLLALLHHINLQQNRNKAFPSLERLMKMTSLSRATIGRCLKSTEAKGYFISEQRMNNSKMYYWLWGLPAHLKDYPKPKNEPENVPSELSTSKVLPTAEEIENSLEAHPVDDIPTVYEEDFSFFNEPSQAPSSASLPELEPIIVQRLTTLPRPPVKRPIDDYEAEVAEELLHLQQEATAQANADRWV